MINTILLFKIVTRTYYSIVKLKEYDYILKDPVDY